MTRHTEESPPAGEQIDARSFWALVGVMFQGAFSDNVYRFVLTMLALDLAATMATGPEATALGAQYIQYIGIAFALPWILAVSFAGFLGDRFSKTRVTQGTKVMEIAVMSLATVVFFTHSYTLGLLVMFLMALQSALFGPSKYGILPELMPTRRLGWGNGVLQGFTFLSIVLGTITGPVLYAAFADSGLWMAGVWMVGFAAVGLAISLRMRVLPAANPEEKLNVNPWPMLRRYGGEILAHTGLRWAIFGGAVFWAVAIMFQGAAIQILKQVLGISDFWVGVALLPIVVGMGLGSFLVGHISRDRIELGLVPFGALGICATAVLVNLATPTLGGEGAVGAGYLVYTIPVLMGLVGFCCGAFIVPLQAYVVATTDARLRAGVWATGNVVTAIGWILGSVMLGTVVGLRENPGDAFLVGGVVTLVAAIVVAWRFPLVPLRFMALVFLRLFYDVRVRHAERLPATGGGLIAPNHQSFMDALLISILTDRPIRFIMARSMYEKWYIQPFALLTNSIPVTNTATPRELIAALREATEEIRAGGLVCIFPEGQLTRNGQIQPYRRGVDRIMKGLKAPIIPVAIDGAFETPWALRWGKSQTRLILRTHRLPISLAVGHPLPANTPPAELRRATFNLTADAFECRRGEAEPLHRMAVRTLRLAPFQKRTADHATDGMIPNVKLLAATVALGRRLAPMWKREEAVGILLPPSVGAVAVNLAASLGGRTAVNLNYTVGESVMGSIVETAGIRLVVTSRAFVEKINPRLPERLDVVYLEDIRESLTSRERRSALLQGLFLPLPRLERLLGRRKPASMDDTVTLVFSSGSTGVPKGVMLSHWNIWANCRAVLNYVDLSPEKTLLGVLPFFHSFGYTVAMWLPLMSRVRIVLYPNPLDAGAIGTMVARYRVTLLFGTPTFLLTYARRIPPEAFGSLEMVVAGAEKLRPSVADAFEQRFGIRPVEGYGCTECSPVVAMSGLTCRGPNLYQRGDKRGSVGQPLFGTALRLTDLETGEELPVGRRGMLHVRGPQIMAGYYKMPDKTAEVLNDGWYTTGDLAEVDEEGFLYIRDRLSRFSKIGGEMVPHLRVEEELHKAAGIDALGFAVVGVPDDRKGERLAVLYAVKKEEAQAAAEALETAGLPALWLPRWADFIPVEEIPVLGSGKMDLQALRRVAQERLVEGTPAAG